MSRQLPLALRWPRRQRFEHYHAGANAAALAAAQHAASDARAPWLVLAGPPASGKTHLLVAACQHAWAAQRRVQYLPLARLGAHAAQAIRGGGDAELLALDDLQAIVGNAPAQHALFDIYNRSRAQGATLLFATSGAPAQLPLELADLRSRLGACTLATLKPLDEAERRQVLRQHAASRGIELEETVLNWLFTHYARDLGALKALLERLDRASLAAKRRITVPFLRDVLSQT